MPTVEHKHQFEIDSFAADKQRAIVGWYCDCGATDTAITTRAKTAAAWWALWTAKQRTRTPLPATPKAKRKARS